MLECTFFFVLCSSLGAELLHAQIILVPGGSEHAKSRNEWLNILRVQADFSKKPTCLTTQTHAKCRARSITLEHERWSQLLL